MSSPPPPVPSPGMPTWLKWVLGLAIGCFVLVLACCGGSCLFGKALVGDLVGKFRDAEQEAGLARAATDRIAAIDAEHPPVLPEDVSTAVLTEDDVQRYLRIRRTLEPQAAEYQAVIDGALPRQGGAIGVTRGVFGMLGASLDAAVARRKLLEAAEPVLRAEGIGPTDFARLVEIVEWRFLRAEDARFLGLPEDRRREVLQLQLELRMLEAWTAEGVPPGFRVNDRTREEALEDLQRNRDKIAVLLAEADARTALAPETLAVLEPHRTELDAVSNAALQAMAPLTAEPPLVLFAGAERDGHGRGIRIEREGRWESGRSEGDGTDGPSETTGPHGEPEPSEATSPTSPTPGTAP